MRLVDADKILEILKRMHGIERTRYDDGLDAAEAVVDAAETVEPVKHGHWIDTGWADYYLNKEYRCSWCDRVDYARSNFCPYCGAKMDGDNNDPSRV